MAETGMSAQPVSGYSPAPRVQPVIRLQPAGEAPSSSAGHGKPPHCPPPAPQISHAVFHGGPLSPGSPFLQAAWPGFPGLRRARRGGGGLGGHLLPSTFQINCESTVPTLLPRGGAGLVRDRQHEVCTKALACRPPTTPDISGEGVCALRTPDSRSS